MKNKLFILAAIIFISFVWGICINHFTSPKDIVDDGSLSIIGTIKDITDNVASIEPQDENLKNSYEYIKFNLPEGEENSWVIGDIVNAKYLPENFTEDGFITLTALELHGKARLFNSTNLPNVSNSDPKGNKIVFKSFFAYDTNIRLDNFQTNDEFYYKKITSYVEYEQYKKIIPELRTLTENDFINYYLIIAMSKSTDYVYMFNKVEEEENSITLEILKNKTLSITPQKPVFSGVAIILPNIKEVPVENINLTIKK